MQPVRLGGVPASLGTPDRYVTVAEGDRAILRADIYAYGPDCFAFEDAIVWRDTLVVGFGSHVHGVRLASRSSVTIPLEAYFGHFYPTTDYLLIASCEHLFRMAPDGSIAWKSGILAVDGIVVHDPGPPTIRGDAEWDPPGGWRPFSVSATDGKVVG